MRRDHVACSRRGAPNGWPEASAAGGRLSVPSSPSCRPQLVPPFPVRLVFDPFHVAVHLVVAYVIIASPSLLAPSSAGRVLIFSTINK